MEGVIETAENSIITFQNIIRLRDEIERNKLIILGRKQQDAHRLINEMYRQPVMHGSQIAEILGSHASTANRMINDLTKLGILKELTGYKRNRIYSFAPYVQLFHD